MLIRLNFMAIGCLDTDAAELDYEDNFFDAIIDNFTIYANQIDGVKEMHRECIRILKPGGKKYI